MTTDHRGAAALLRKTEALPTRPHPSAPDTPPANRLPAPGAGTVDRVGDVGDALTGRGRD